MLHGKWVDYYLSGNIKSITNYNFDKKDGLEIYFYENGNKKSETLYDNNISIQNTIRWDIKGEILK
jgi:antitoxin component YwqK of YwqJK toxin-antitoxin module